MKNESKNLEAISKAIDKHNASCEFDLVEIRMNPFEVERLGWDSVRGVPIVGDGELGTGSFILVCTKGKELDEELEDVAVESDLVNV